MLDRFVALVGAEAARQNLVSAATLPQIWRRHIVDSAQLLDHAADRLGKWIDVGSGAGFPGMVIAILSDRPVVLVEPRRMRAEFLLNAATALGIAERVSIQCMRAERLQDIGSVISARAVASLNDLLTATHHLSTKNTQWVLPKGRSAREEVAMAQRTWHGVFHVEQSLTDRESMIILAEKVARR